MDVTPGWYPDPDDATNLRWWDGSAWTDHRQPIGQPRPVEPEPAESEASDTAVEAPLADDPTAAMGQIPPPPPPPVAGGGYPGTPTPPPPTGVNGDDKRKPILIGVGVVAILAMAAGMFLFFSGDDGAEYTWDGEDIAELDATLEAADETFLAGVEERNGAVTRESRCYMVQSADDDVDRPSDVFDFLRCGPVLFVDDDPSDGVWITYALSASENDDGGLTLTSAEAPQNSQPSHYDEDEETLSRPDGEDPPDGDGDIEPPDPPRAEAGLLLSGDPALDELDLDSAFVLAVGLTKSVDLVGTSEPSRYGAGDTARRPADAERFIAFEIRMGPGDSHYGTPAEQSAASSSSAATVSLDVDGEETVIANGDDEDYDHRHLVSVPDDAETVDLVLNDSDVTQRISLLTQEPSSDNIRVLARTSRDVELGDSRAFPVTIAHPDGAVQQDTFTVTIVSAELLYYVDDAPDRLPSGPGRAFLVIHHFLTSDVTAITAEDEIGLEPGHLHLETDGGDVLEAVNLAPSDGDILIAFEVSGAFDGATLAVRGSAPSGDINIDLGDPDFRVPIAIDGS